VEKGLVIKGREFWRSVDVFLDAEGTLLAEFDELTRKQEAGGSKAAARPALLARSTPTLVTGAGRCRPPVQDTTLVYVEALTRGFRHFDYLEGASSVAGDVTTHLNRLLAMADAVPEGLHKRYHLAVGDTAQLAAWLAIDQQDYPLAKRLCGTALEHAAGVDTDLHAYVMGIIGYTHMHHRRGRPALDVLDGAVRIARSGPRAANPAVLSWLYEAIGEAHGINGEHREGRMALRRAETLFESVATVPHWLGFFNSQAHLERLKGRCLMRLGEGRFAIKALQNALGTLPEDFVREQSGTLIDLAAAYLLPDVLDPAAAANAAIQAHDLAVITGSARNLKRVKDDLLPALKPYRSLRDVKTLAGALG
jgi:tetratricopeptide (TPR) repeat protein